MPRLRSLRLILAGALCVSAGAARAMPGETTLTAAQVLCAGAAAQMLRAINPYSAAYEVRITRIEAGQTRVEILPPRPKGMPSESQRWAGGGVFVCNAAGELLQNQIYR